MPSAVTLTYTPQWVTSDPAEQLRHQGGTQGEGTRKSVNNRIAAGFRKEGLKSDFC